VTQEKHLITSALPYANGPIHFGHLAGAYFPGDVYNRHQKMKGNKTLFICGSDEHGVAIMLNAKKADEDYQTYVNKWHKQHSELFKAAGIDFDFFGQTSSDYHAEEVVRWFEVLNEKGLIDTQDMEQLYCNSCNNHLPDRFVEGTCYKCGFEGARGDECSNCGELIDPVKLKDPVCKICGYTEEITPVTVTQYYLMLSKYHKEFRSWFESRTDWRKTVFPYVDGLTKESLHDRAISRDLDWGIDVPLAEAKGKKLYVWFDAPIGYVSNTKKFLEDTGSSEHYLNDWWNNKDVKISNFIGKDNIIFHAVIFPCMSMASGFARPTDQVPANQFLNLNGKQFSKSTGWYIEGNEAISEFGQDAIRYYLLSILPEGSDSSFTWEQFEAKVNNELANNIGNFLNRCLKFISKNWPDGLEKEHFAGFADSEWGKTLNSDIKELHQLLDEYKVRQGLEKLMLIGQTANNYFSDQAPWAQIKEDRDAAAKTLAYSAIYAMTLGVLFTPFLPSLSGKILNHFEALLSDELRNEIYNGNIGALENAFTANGLHLTKEVVALVPKLDKDLVASKIEHLKSLENS
jgi:methionyl-tRNA synthetase